MRTDQKSQTLSALTLTNVLLGMLCLAFAAGFLYIQLGSGGVDPAVAKPYVEVAQERLQEHSAAIQEEVVDLTADTVPPIAEAVYAQAKEDYPEYLAALQDEGDVYLANVEEMIRTKVRAKYRDYLAAHRQVLVEEFPEHASEEKIDKVLKEFEVVFDKLVDRYYLEDFRREAKRTQTLWAKFEPLPPPEANEPSFEEQLADYIADWAVIALAEEGVEAVKPALAAD